MHLNRLCFCMHRSNSVGPALVRIAWSWEREANGLICTCVSAVRKSGSGSLVVVLRSRVINVFLSSSSSPWMDLR